MPITNGKQIRRITSMCGCSIPEKLKKILDRYEDNPIAMREAGIAYAMENADDEVKAVATALAPANSQAGVYQVLENWLEKEG